jgi:hypothetical protein
VARPALISILNAECYSIESGRDRWRGLGGLIKGDRQNDAA